MEKTSESNLKNLEHKAIPDDITADEVPNWLVGVIIVLLMLVATLLVVIITRIINRKNKNRESVYCGPRKSDDLESGKIEDSSDSNMVMTSFTIIPQTSSDTSFLPHSATESSDGDQLISTPGGVTSGVQGHRNPIFEDDDAKLDNNDKNYTKISTEKDDNKTSDNNDINCTKLTTGNDEYKASDNSNIFYTKISTGKDENNAPQKTISKSNNTVSVSRSNNNVGKGKIDCEHSQGTSHHHKLSSTKLKIKSADKMAEIVNDSDFFEHEGISIPQTTETKSGSNEEIILKTKTNDKREFLQVGDGSELIVVGALSGLNDNSLNQEQTHNDINANSQDGIEEDDELKSVSKYLREFEASFSDVYKKFSSGHFLEGNMGDDESKAEVDSSEDLLQGTRCINVDNIESSVIISAADSPSDISTECVISNSNDGLLSKNTGASSSTPSVANPNEKICDTPTTVMPVPYSSSGTISNSQQTALKDAVTSIHKQKSSSIQNHSADSKTATTSLVLENVSHEQKAKHIRRCRNRNGK